MEANGIGHSVLFLVISDTPIAVLLCIDGKVALLTTQSHATFLSHWIMRTVFDHVCITLRVRGKAHRISRISIPSSLCVLDDVVVHCASASCRSARRAMPVWK